MPLPAAPWPTAAERRESERLRNVFGKAAAFWCSAKASKRGDKCRPEPIRELTSRTAAALARPGDGLRQVLRWTNIPGPVVEISGRVRRVFVSRRRAMRWERYDGAGLVLLLLLAHMDIVTGDVCRDESRDFFGMEVSTIAEKLGLCQRRVERILRVFIENGLIESWRRSGVDKTTGAHYGKTAIRKLNLAMLLPLVHEGLPTKWEQTVRDTSAARTDAKRVLSGTQRAMISAAEAVARTHARRQDPEGFRTGASLAAQIAAATARPGSSGRSKL